MMMMMMGGVDFSICYQARTIYTCLFSPTMIWHIPKRTVPPALELHWVRVPDNIGDIIIKKDPRRVEGNNPPVRPVPVPKAPTANNAPVLRHIPINTAQSQQSREILVCLYLMIQDSLFSVLMEQDDAQCWMFE